MEEKQMLFSDEDLKAMIVPLFLEQFLVMLVGIADTLVVSHAGEAAVSGVSLVNQFTRSSSICLQRWHPAARSCSASTSAGKSRSRRENLPVSF